MLLNLAVAKSTVAQCMGLSLPEVVLRVVLRIRV